MPKKKKSKKRKRSIDLDVECQSSPNPEAEKGKKSIGTRGDKELKQDNDSVSATPPRKKKKKSKLSVLKSDHTVEATIEDSKGSHDSKSKASKRKKKKKKSKSATTESVKADSRAEDSADTATALEGLMVNDQMVLVDREKGKVYSSTDKQENGDYLQIGIVEKDGEINLSMQQEQATSSQPEFPFPVDADDHCESPLTAYQDILPFLHAVKGKKPAALHIYDPYYCNGSVADHLKSLGFPNVYNKKEDCYDVWANPSRYPAHDLLVTNPPYSGDHIEKLIKHITGPSFGNRPWMLLLPQWVHKKDYYLKLTQHIRPFYLVPHKRYVYLPPPAFREAKKSDVHKKSSPFVSMWFLWGGTMQQNEQWLSRVARSIKTCDVARSKSALRDLRRKGSKKK